MGVKAISKIVKKDNEIKKMCFSNHQLTKIIFNCFTKKEIRKNNIGQSDNYSNNKINIRDHDKNNDETKNYRIFEKKKKEEEEESIKGIISNGNANTINNKIEDEDDNTKNKENLKIDIANKIFKMLYCVEVECEKNYLFKKNWVYSFAFKSLPPLIQNKIKDSEKEEYIHFDTLLSTIVKILKEDKQVYAMFTHDELNVIIWRDLCKILEENRKLNEGKK